MEAKKSNFPKRNRIISGMSDVVLVVEAEYRSGTAITAKYAKEQGKTICCLPSNIDSRCGYGTNKLIQEGAKLIIKPQEIINIIENEKSNEIAEQEKLQMNKEQKQIYELISKTPIHINDICKKTGKNIQEISQILTMLELEELIVQLPGNEFKVKE